MLEIIISVEIHCERPNWAILTPQYSTSRYRIYVDDNLITERNWNWNNNTFLTEKIWIHGAADKDHILNLYPVIKIPKQAEFKLNNLLVTNLQAKVSQIDDLTVSFKI